MWGRFYLHVILLIFTNIFYVSCQEKGSLTFVIDISTSMGDDLNQVRKSALWEIDQKYSIIKNLILVTFNDAGATVVVDTEDREVFKKHLNKVRLRSVRTWDGTWRNYDDCPENSMNGVIEGLKKSLPGSYIYVFTDASAKDYNRSVEIKRLCQKKQSQIFFILTGKCSYEFDTAYHVYYDIAAACTGLAIDVDKSQVQKVFDSLKGTNTEITTVLKSVTVPRDTTTYVPFEIDDETEYAIVTASGDNVELKVVQERTSSYAKQIKDVWFSGIKVIKLYNLVPGEYKAVVWGSSEVSVYIVAKTDFIFSHGFSKLEPKNIDDTTKQPINGAKTHLSVLIHDPKHTVNIVSGQILDMNEKVIKAFHLKRVNGDFYTTEPFIAPSKRFKVAVIGNAKTDGKETKRIAKIPVTPQDPPIVLPDPKSPVITISEGSQIVVEYDKTVKLTCKVSAYPEPKITWRNSYGTELKSQSAIVELPYEYISYLTISNFIESDTFTCHAENAMYTRKGKNIQVIVKNPFVIKSTIQGTTELKYGEKGILTCDIRGSVPIRILWRFKNNQGKFTYINTSDKYTVSADGTQLIINKMNLDLVGEYSCSAYVLNKPDKEVNFKKRVEIGGLEVPKISGEPEKTVKVGDEVKIKCNIFGVPKPTITWQFMGKGDSKFVSISSTDNVLQISNVTVKHAGRYKCVAHNIVGQTSHDTILTVQVPPVITTNTNVFKIVEDRDRVLRIPCEATGDPKPDISWEMRGATIKPNSKYAMEDGVLIIKNPTVADGLTYTCLAKNKAGSIHKTFDVKVFQVPKISGEPEKTVKIGDEVKIKCNIFGVPKPTITWQFMGKGDSKFVSISSTDNVLQISNVTVKHAGRYKCVAHNIIGQTSHDTILTVQVPPVITTNTNVFKIVEDRDRVLRIPCEATGDPKPDISWEMRGASIKPNSKYAMEDGVLIIKNPSVADGLTYKCLAKNKAGSIHKTFDVKVFQIPKISGEPEKTVKIGDEVKIKCNIFGVPKPTITWQFIGKGDSKFVSISSSDNVLQISNVTVKHAGRYKCVAHNIVEETDHVTVLTVQVPPIITTNTNVFKIVEDQDKVLRISCEATGDPKPDISWEMRGATIKPNSKYAIHEGALIINNPTVADGLTYKCLAKNKAGSIDKTFDVKVFQKPKVSGEPVMTVKTGDAVQIKCNVIKGVPEPKINWEFMAEKSGVFVQKSGKVLSIPYVNRTFDGRYKCIAQNSAGSDEHTTTLNVEFAPIIKRSSETFKALNGDVALKIPCHVIGLPQPEIIWKLNGTVLSPDSDYSMVEGALIIKNPKNEYQNFKTLHYTCEAKNYLGSDKAKFIAEIHSTLDDNSTRTIVHLLDKTSPKLECVPANPKQSVRWFLQEKELNVTTKYIQLHDLDILKEGNYSCRVSDMNGGHTYTYEALVGYPPTFDQDEDPIFDWTGTKHDTLDCVVNARPRADIVWSYNGKVLEGQESGQLVLSGNWGLYACNVSNVHGAVYRAFEVTSSRCLIPRIPKDTKTAGKMPLILTTELKWPLLDSVEDYLTANHDEIILLSCPHREAKNNFFQKLPTLNKISATCDKEDIFIVNGTRYHVSELQCTDEVDAVVIKKEGNCLTESSELIRVGYEINGFLETYRVCFDTSKNMPLFSRVIMSKSNIGQGLTYSWHKHPSIDYSRDDGRYTCNSSNLTCCYGKKQLVNVREVMDGSPQRSTFIDPLNAVPYWHPCDGKDPLAAIERNITLSTISYNQLIVWSGTHDLRERNGQVTPRYLWKVVKFDISEEAIAIVYINDESPSKSDVLCKNIYDEQNNVNTYLNLLKVPIKNFYCCKLYEFLQSFGLLGTSIGES